MRTLDVIFAEIQEANLTNDSVALHALAQELHAIGTPRAVAASLNTLGNLYNNTADYPAALDHYRRALVLFEQLGNHKAMSNTTLNMGVAYSSVGDYSSALESFQRAMSMSEVLGDCNGLARATLNVGILYQSTGDYASALEYLRRSLSMSEELGNRNHLATATLNIGIVYFRTGNYPKAIEHIQKALSVSEELGNLEGMAASYSNMGAVYGEMGEHSSSLEQFRRALAIHQEQGNRSGVANNTCDMGILYSRSGDHSTALECFRQAIVLQEELGNNVGLANSFGDMIAVLLDTNQDDEAATMLDQQSTMLMSSPLVRAEYAANRAKLAEHGGDLDAAREFLAQALSIVSESGSRAESSMYHLRLRDLAQKRNDFAGFIEHNAEYQRITEEIRGKDATQKMAVMAAERKAEQVELERVKERALLYGALPESVATRMLRGENVSGDHYDHVSVIFLDIVGFTSISDMIPPGQVVRLLSQIFSALDDVVERHGVTKIKTIGDSYMAVAFPLESSSSEQLAASIEERAARTALDMLHAVSHIVPPISSPIGSPTSSPTGSPTSSPEGSPASSPLQVRIGLHSGPVTAGVIGTQRLQYDVWGDTVNVASRMESSSEPGRIHVSSSFALALSLRHQDQRLPELRQGETAVIPSLSEEHGTSSPFPVPSSLIPREEIEIKGKGTMQTYWLE